MSYEAYLVFTAFVLISGDIGDEARLLKRVRKVKGVKEAFALYGTYDIIAKVASDSMDELKHIITWRIRKLAGVRATLTLMEHRGTFVTNVQMLSSTSDSISIAST